MYESLCNVHDEFCLYIFAFDTKSKEFLISLKLDRAVIIGLEEFEDEELLKIKPSRTFGEYCWTCTPSSIKYAIEKYNLPDCTYLDADLYFYSSPTPIFNELSSFAVGLTPHNYSPEYDLSKASGKYCVQFVFFRNMDGMIPLDWWRRECLKWCYAYSEGDKYGDQKYLDRFSTLFPATHDIQHIGTGIAPWNVLKFSFSLKDNKIILKNKDVEEIVIFYHFQNLKIDLAKKIIWLGKWYDCKPDVIELFYKPYIEKLLYFENIINEAEYKIEDFKIIKSNRLELIFFYTVQRIFGGNNFFRMLYNKINLILGRRKS